jgi:hypothetical protein
MKTIIVKLAVCMMIPGSSFSLFNNLIAQEQCKVLKPEISSSYIGKCKKGLADGKGKSIGKDTYEGQFKEGWPWGKGTYTWANGDTYTGDWEKGLRDGEGDFTFKVNEKDTVVSGLWENDRYKGPRPVAPEVITKVSIDRYNIYKLGHVKDRVLIEFLQNGMPNAGITNLLINSTSGTETSLGKLIGYENIIFPVVIKVNYMTWNKLRSQQFQAIFEFKITEPGDWRVEIHN